MRQCPETDELAAAIAGGSGSEAIIMHIENCGSCRARADRMRENASGTGRASTDGDGRENCTRQGAADAAPHVNADMIPGYEILSEIQRGGQGVVYKAIQKSTRRKVAIKLMHAGALDAPQDKLRFDREVQILGQLDHPNIVTIQDSGSVGGRKYLVMNYIPGRSLDAYCTGASSSVGRTLALFAKICEAVNVAHLRGVIHRDLKPSNVRVDECGEPHVLDFGLAKTVVDAVTDETRAQFLTKTGQFAGSLPWASPEQIDGDPRNIDIRTDVYSLGVVLYYLLADRFPYDISGNMRDVLDNICAAEPAPLRARHRGIDDEVQSIVFRCLEKHPARRYQTAGELARDIRSYLAGEPIEAKRGSGWYLLKKTMRRYRGRVMIAAGFAVVVGVACIVTGAAVWNLTAERARLVELQLQRAADLGEYGDELIRDRDYAAAQSRYAEMRDLTEALLQESPSDGRAMHQFLSSLISLSETARRQNDFSSERRYLEQGLRSATRLEEEAPDNLTNLRDLVLLCAALSGVEQRDKNDAKALECSTRAYVLTERLRRADPSNPRYERDLAVSGANLGFRAIEAGNFKLAGDYLNDAAPVFEDLLEEQPGNGLHRDTLAKCYEGLFEIAQARGDDNATQGFAARFHDLAGHADAKARFLNWYARKLSTDPPEALRDDRAALRAAERAVAQKPANPGYLDTLALAFHRNGKNARAVEIQRRALDLLSLDDPGRERLQDNLDRYSKAGDVARRP